ncbi:hypothetical protein PINS_up000879 [Pythium insidiosum]|nr:hypothetical protein PINS_up000879 [Pythium insidiosum]
MDELHDAIQDAQYIGAVTNAQRGPSAAFYNPTHTELSQFVERQERSYGSDWLNLENILDQPLGFYFLRRFCEAEQHGVPKLQFLVEVTKFRALSAPEKRLIKAREMYDRFCHPTTSTATSASGTELQRSASPKSMDIVPPGVSPVVEPMPPRRSSATSGPTTDSIGRHSNVDEGLDSPAGAALTPRHSLINLKEINVAAITTNGVVFWRKGESTVTRGDVTELYKACASETSPIGVSGDAVKRVATLLKRKAPGSTRSTSSATTVSPRSSSGTSMAITMTGDSGVASPPSPSRDGAVESPLTLSATPSTTPTPVPSSPLGDRSLRQHSYRDHSDRSQNTFGRNSESHTAPPPLGHSGSSARHIGTSLRSDAELMKACPTTLFDELEACVLCSLESVHLKEFRASVFHRRFLAFLYLQTRKVVEDDFTVLRVLGRGGFGMVNGCIKRTSASLYAMKVMNKKMIKKKHAEKLCIAERKILAMISSPFVVCLKYAFQTTEELFLVLDLRTGGDLSFHLNRCRFTESQVRFWAAQILLGLQHLHEKNIVYRDLKPENILLDEKGNCSISDLGLAVEVTPNLAGRCGTRGYWAPEMLLRDENGQRMVYNHAVDWWSYGCLVYELLYGKCPFRTSKAKALHEDKQQAYDKATLELTPSYDPKYFSPEAAELIQQLLIRDPKKRLGANGAEEVKRMRFFDPIDWAKIESMAVPPPFVPDNEINAASQADIGSFDISVVKGVKLTEQDQVLYNNWDYICPETFQREAIEYLEWEVKHGPCTVTPGTNQCCALL